MIGNPEQNGDAPRLLVVNADDFGLSERTNEGILRAHAQGIVTSTSVMVRKSSSSEAVHARAMYPDLALGLHLDIGEWNYADGKWHPDYEVVPSGDACALRREVLRQLNAFRDLLNSEPSHIDSHQHVHLHEPLRSIVAEVIAPLRLPVRQFGSAIRYTGCFYGQNGHGEPLPAAIQPSALVDLIAELPQGMTELGCHPGLDERLESPYCAERLVEVETLCHFEVRNSLRCRGIHLVSFEQASKMFEWEHPKAPALASIDLPPATETAR